MLTRLRRIGHIIERAPGNLASQLRGNGRDNTQHAFLTNGPTDVPQPDNQWANDFAQPDASYPAWGTGTSQPAWQQPQQQQQPIADQAYAAMEAEWNENSDNGTDTDTESSCGIGELELPTELPATATQAEIGQVLWADYQKTKSNWRRFNGNKPVRAVRRFVRRKGKGKGKDKGHGKGKRVGAYLAGLSDTEVDGIFFGKAGGKKGGSKGFHKGKCSTGFGKGRRGNPKDSSGNTMECFICGSTDHLRDHCPNRDSKGAGKGSVQMFAHQHSYHYHTAPTSVPVQSPHWTDAFPTHDENIFNEGPLAGLLGQIDQPDPPTEPVHQVFTNTQSSGSSQATYPLPKAQAVPPHYPPAPTLPPTSAQPDPWMTMGDPWLQHIQGLAAGNQPPQMPTTGNPPQQIPAHDIPLPPDTVHHHMPAFDPHWLITHQPPPEVPSWAEPEVLGETLGFTSYAYNDRPLGPGIMTTESMFSGAYEPTPSSLELVHQPFINTMAATHATLDDWYAGGDTPILPTIGTTSSLDGQHHSFIDEFWQVQQHNDHMFEKGKRKGKGKGKGKGQDPETATPAPSQGSGYNTPMDDIEFDGDDRVCSICLEEFEGNDRVIRLI